MKKITNKIVAITVALVFIGCIAVSLFTVSSLREGNALLNVIEKFYVIDGIYE